MSGFAEKLNIQNFKNSARDCVNYTCTEVWICREIEYLELPKFNGKLCTLNVLTVWIYREIENPELSKFNGKLGSLNVRTVWIFK